MKCRKCPALVREGYEYPEEYCSVGGDEAGIDWPDGECGCTLHPATVRKRVRENEEAREREYEGMAEWYREQQGKERAMLDAVLACFPGDSLRHAAPLGPDVLARALLAAYEDSLAEGAGLPF